jgi:hypothetical protein
MVNYHGLGRRRPQPRGFVMRPLLNGGTLAGQLSLSRFQEWWASLARDLDLRVQIPFQVVVGQNTVDIPVLLEDFGAQRGMLLVTELASIATIEAQLVALGFGYSCMSEPTSSEFTTEGLPEMLSDWGWSGVTQPSPRLAALLAQHTPEEVSD